MSGVLLCLSGGACCAAAGLLLCASDDEFANGNASRAEGQTIAAGALLLIGWVCLYYGVSA